MLCGTTTKCTFAQLAAILVAGILLVCTPQPAGARPVKAGPPAAASPLPVREASFAADVCRLIENRARWRGIDPHFITRLIHTESRFSPNAVSPAGAQGIAQFIPSTARLRNLADPFDPANALTASIDYLSELRSSFGNLGLAAVAYNAGEGAARRFVAGGGIPWETENYVLSITGRPAADWRERSARYQIPVIHDSKPFGEACPEHVARPGRVRIAAPATAARKPWGVQVAEHFSQAAAVSIYQRLKRRFPAGVAGQPPMLVPVRNRSMGTRMRHAARIGADSQAEAMQICQALQARSIACLVRKTP
jgi:hypothetical protein